MLEKIKSLVAAGEYRVSSHGYDELENDGILQEDIVQGLARAEVIEDYPDYFKGPCILVLQRDVDQAPLHALWGLAKDTEKPAVLITAYRPALNRWSRDFRRRKP